MAMKRSKESGSTETQKRFAPLMQAVAEVELRELLHTLWRRRSVVFGMVFFLTALATVIVFQLTPRYTGIICATPHHRKAPVSTPLRALACATPCRRCDA